MRYYQFKPTLLEYRRDITANNIGSQLKNVAANDPTFINIPEEGDDSEIAMVILGELERLDPTPNKKYTQWLARTYAKGDFKFEDVSSTISDRLEKYEILKSRKRIDSKKSDINTFKDFVSFLDYVDSLPNPEKREQANKGNFQITYEDDYCTVVWPKDEVASKYFGKGTRWCTAADNNNYFSSYNERGGLRILLPKKNVRTRPNEKYQLFMKLWQARNQDGEIDAQLKLTVAAESDVEEDNVDASNMPEHFYEAYDVISNQLLKNKLPSIYSGYNEITIKSPLYSTVDKYKLERSNDWRAYSHLDIQSIIIDQLEKSNLSENKTILNEADFKQIYVMLTPTLGDR